MWRLRGRTYSLRPCESGTTMHCCQQLRFLKGLGAPATRTRCRHSAGFAEKGAFRGKMMRSARPRDSLVYTRSRLGRPHVLRAPIISASCNSATIAREASARLIKAASKEPRWKRRWLMPLKSAVENERFCLWDFVGVHSKARPKYMSRRALRVFPLGALLRLIAN